MKKSDLWIYTDAGSRIDLDSSCLDCHGAGHLDDDDTIQQNKTCPLCAGVGKVPTANGHALLLFVERHYIPSTPQMG